MENTNVIFYKLELFIRKYYSNELIRGLIFFVGLGMFYFIFTLFVEYLFWLKPLGRTLLFWTFVAVESYLFLRLILFPIFQLLKLKKGLDFSQASKIIGSHFPEVKDKLLNFLQLSSDKNHSELLVASIEQRANSLRPITFGNAINYKKNKKYLPLAILPIFLLCFFYLSGNGTIISQSLNRVVHFDQQFLPPAPFEFILLNPNLQTEQNKDFVIRVKTKGKVVPASAKIFIGNESYFLENIKSGEFQFKVEKPAKSVIFHLEANSILSREYNLKVVTVPSIANFEMVLKFPNYIKRKSEIINGNGNAVVLEGTTVTWKIKALATQKIIYKDIKFGSSFSKSNDIFKFSKTIFESSDYQIITSNAKVDNYEKLNYQISVIKDQFPTITVRTAPDSLNVDKNYVFGQISDDYGLSKLQVVYYPKDKIVNAKRATIAIKSALNDQFVFAFPASLPVEKGVLYEYYFEVFDNDAIHRFKSTKSSPFLNRIITNEEKENEILQQQNENVNSLQKSLKNQDKQITELEKIQNTGKEKDNFEFNDQQKINEYIKNQSRQDKMMKEFAQKMKDNLDKTKSADKDDFKDDLKTRLENIDKDLEKNKKLLDELKELNDKIKQDELMDKMDKFKQNAKNQAKSLEQLVVLTKKFYIQKKAAQIKDKLDKLANKQDELSNLIKENNQENQDKVNREFQKIKEELKDLEKDNKELKKPLDIGEDKNLEKSTDEDLEKALNELKKENKANAKPKQKSAARKMKQMSQKMEKDLDAGESERLEEDVAMLRQVLDNLLAFSFGEEDLMGKFKNQKSNSPAFNKNLTIQQNLKLQFKHIDDSLFALSLRNPKIGENITKEIGNAQYNIDKSLETLVDAQIGKGISHQQYVISSANTLANLLAETLNNMQMSLSGMGSGKPKPGKGDGLQLSDIIKKQDGLGDKVKKGMENGKKPGDGKEADQGQKSNGKEGKGQSGEKGDSGEGDAKAIMEIYKEQQQLRESLQNELNKQGMGSSGKNALEQMKDLEKQLLNKGFKNENLQKILNIKQELLKLNTAVQQQGQEKKRQSESNKKEFSNPSSTIPPALLDYLNSIEILNRQSLPLRSNYNQKVNEYFNNK